MSCCGLQGRTPHVTGAGGGEVDSTAKPERSARFFLRCSRVDVVLTHPPSQHQLIATHQCHKLGTVCRYSCSCACLRLAGLHLRRCSRGRHISSCLRRLVRLLAGVACAADACPREGRSEGPYMPEHLHHRHMSQLHALIASAAIKDGREERHGVILVAWPSPVQQFSGSYWAF